MVWLIPLITAAAGAAAGAISTKQRGDAEKAELEHRKQNAWAQYELGKKYSDESFGIQKDEALKQLAVQKKNLDAQVGMSIGDFNTSLLAQAFGMQDALIGSESQIGMSLAAEGAGGTRGNGANEMMRTYAAEGLQRSFEVQERQSKDYLGNLIAGANMGAAAIADEKASWMDGGYRMRSKQAQDAHNLGMANLGQADFDWTIARAAPTGMDYATSMLGSASTGFSIGDTADQIYRDWYYKGNPKINFDNILAAPPGAETKKFTGGKLNDGH